MQIDVGQLLTETIGSKLDLHVHEEMFGNDEINYYHSNSIARASKTMTDCKNARVNFKKTGTEA